MLGFRKRKQIDTGKSEEGRQLTLVFDDEMGIPKEDEYVFRYHAKRLPMLRDNQLSIELLNAEPLGDDLSIVALFRNTLPGSFEIKELTVLLLDANNLPVGRKVLGRAELPDFEPWTSKPVYLDFFEDELFADIESYDALRLVFQMNPSDKLQPVSPTEEAKFSKEAWQHVMRTNISTPPVGEDEFNLLLVSVEENETGVTVALLLRNGYTRSLAVSNLPVELVSGDTVVGFTSVRLEEPVQGKQAYPVSVTFDEVQADGPFTVRVRQ
ncbi:SLAP domain-containing protein [Exiguobacterium algae]|uniref:SLAP domain-containing protein n=1 Tax=Exiguobacterium algae TaxID=2751250 RepID=UPI001BEBAA91|nr:SLAP domain-containing protein [Exiguobacterium algae]